MSLLHRHPSGRLERCRSRVKPCPFGGPVGQTLSRNRSGNGAPSVPDAYNNLPLMSSGAGKHIGVQVESVSDKFSKLSENDREAIMSKIDESLVKVDRDYTNRNAAAWRREASSEELSAVQRYTTSEYRKYNGWKILGRESSEYPKYANSDEELRVDQEAFVNDVEGTVLLLDSAFSRGDGEPAMFYRGLGFRHLIDDRGSGTVSESEVISDLMTRFPIGERVSHDGYVSTSSDEKVALTFADRSSASLNSETTNPVRVLMRVRGNTGVSVEDFSYRRNEREFIFNAPMVVGRVTVEGKRKKILIVDVFEESLLESFLK